MSSGAVGRAADRPADPAVAAGWVAVALGAWVVAAGLTGGLASAAPAVIGAAVTRIGMDVAGVLCVGAALLGTLVPRGPAGGVGPVPDRVLLMTSAAWLGLTGLDLVSRAALVAGRPVGETSAADLASFLSGPAAGTGLLVAAVAATLVMVGAAARTGAPERPLPPPPVLLVVALLGLAGPAATGHAAAAGSGVVLAVTAVSVHVAAASLWVGGLGAMLLVAGRAGGALLAGALPRWSRLAGWCLGAVTVSGVVAATTRIGSWPELVTTGYGALVLAKVACLALAGLLGGAARARLRAGRTPVLRWAGVEILVLSVAVGLAATLTQTA